MNQHQLVYLKDYKSPSYLINRIYLNFKIFPEFVFVENTMNFSSNDASSQPLVLNGENLELISIKLGKETLSKEFYELKKDKLIISLSLPDKFSLTITNKIIPHLNKSCEGLYQSGNIFCTQNEPEGFRKITYFIDRPDIMSSYTTRIEADKEEYPILLSNGDLIDKGDLENDRHFTIWEDPFPKPSYLFALVVGDLACQKDYFITKSGRQISLEIYVDKGNENQCQFALDSLKRAMKWDEDSFGLEYDLNTYMIVAVDAFNMGAMENKGLNIFNSSCILADKRTATDQNFQNIEQIIAHEYFHNWTGNRVTCRDWFQLTLKEGLTVYRDQLFSEDMWSSVIKRIEEVSYLRNTQFIEDSGPMRHPIKPNSYLEINNFYTATVYRKGAEVIRMISTLIGQDKFRKGLDKYFELFDGQAVTTEDFIHCMEIVSGKDFTQFKRWYFQSGTPDIDVESIYDKETYTYKLVVEQKLKDGDSPYHFPLCLGLLDNDGKELLSQKIWNINKEKQVLIFNNIYSLPIPSLLRNFSAPVKLHYDYSYEDLIFLLKNDGNEFNRYEAGQKLIYLILDELIASDGDSLIPPKILAIFQEILQDNLLCENYQAKLLQIPSTAELIDKMKIADYALVHKVRLSLMKKIAQSCEDNLVKIFKLNQQKLREKPYALTLESIGRRSLKNVSLYYLNLLDLDKYSLLAFEEFEFANDDRGESANMTDEITTLNILVEYDNKFRQKTLQKFAMKWREDSIVMNKWFFAQASSKIDNLLVEIKSLEKLPYFDMQNPNNIRSLYGIFITNGVIFHQGSGENYKFIIDKIIQIDKVNPSMASNLVTLLKNYPKLPLARKVLLKEGFQRILDENNLSKNVYEIITKIISY